MSRRQYFIYLIITAVVGLCACTEEMNIGEYLYEGSLRGVYTDTLSVQISSGATLDSITTNNKEYVFLGKYEDEWVGTVEANAFIEYARPAAVDANEYAIFDSIVLVMRRAGGEFYGDSTAQHEFVVKRLKEEISFNGQEVKYNTATEESHEEELYRGTFRFKKYGESMRDSSMYELRLKQDFGQELFEGLMLAKEDYKDEYFVKTFAGLAISGGEGCVNKFLVKDTCMCLRLYYHVTGMKREEFTLDINPNPIKSYYHLNVERTELPEMNTKSEPVGSEQMKNVGIVMAGLPIYGRIEFPYLNNLLELGREVRIESARLLIYPLQDSFETISLPTELNIYEHDPTSDARGSALSDGSGVTLNGNLTNNEGFPCYNFDISSFLVEQLGKSGYNKKALSLSIPAGKETSSLQRLVFGDRNYFYKSEKLSQFNRVQLQLTYIIYDAFE